MILLYLLIIPILFLIIWLIVHKTGKALLWTVGILIALIVVGWFVFIWVVSAAFQDKCETKRIWKIEGYEIIEKRCIGFAGPPWHPVYLYQKDIEIDYVNYKIDSCIVKFSNKLGDTLEFDLCAEKIREKKNANTDTNNKNNA